MKRSISLILVILLAFSLLSACSGQNNKGETQETTGTTAGTASSTTEAKSEPVPLTMMVQSHPASPIREDWAVWKAHEKNANVKLTVSGYQGNWWESIPLVVASGDMPDLMWMVLSDSQKYGDQGALVNLLETMDKTPNLKTFMDKQADQVPALMSAEGKLYLHPAYGCMGEYDGLLLYREDIFKKNNISLPKDYDELYSVLKKLKELYPESTPLYFPELFTFTQFGYSFETSSEIFYDSVSKTVKYGPVENNYKALLEFIVRAYKEKLIPVEFASLDDDKFNAMLSTDKTFIFYGYLSNIDYYNSVLREANPDFTLAFMPPPKGPTGKAYTATKAFLGEGLVVTSTSKNKDAALKYLDYLFTEEGATACSWGVEGVTYQVVDGKKQYLPVVNNLDTAGKEFGLFSSGNTGYNDPAARDALLSAETIKSYQEGLKYVAPLSLLPALKKDERDANSIKTKAIGKYVEENITKFIFGQRSLDEWDDYVDAVKKLGLEDVLKVYNDALARAEAAYKK